MPSRRDQELLARLAQQPIACDPTYGEQAIDHVTLEAFADLVFSGYAQILRGDRARGLLTDPTATVVAQITYKGRQWLANEQKRERRHHPQSALLRAADRVRAIVTEREP